MIMGPNDQTPIPPLSRTRSIKRGVVIYGFAGAMFALLFVMTLPSATTWYLVVGSCLLAIVAVVYVAKGDYRAAPGR
jgi:hypothetical protein